MWVIEWEDPWNPKKLYANVADKIAAERIAYGLRVTGAKEVHLEETS